MIKRRDVLFGLGGVIAGALATLARPFRPPPGEAPESVPGIEPPPDVSPEDVYSEFERMEMRYYTQEGVAVFLACENLADTDSDSYGYEPGPLNAEIESQLLDHANILLASDVEPPESDVAQIVQLLAERDFYGLPLGGKP